jgi:hypothetical protein
MNTVAAATRKPLSMDNFEERHDPIFVEWNRPGQAVAGRLLSIEMIEVGEPKQKTARYTVIDELVEDGENPLSSFLGTYQINSKIRKSDIGRLVLVRYEGEDKNIGRAENKMKLFKVYVEKAATKNAHGLEITDAYIGF